MNNVRCQLFKKINFEMTIFLGSDGQNLDVCMSNHSNEYNVSVESSLLYVHIDYSTETLPKCVKQAGAILATTIALTGWAM